MEFLKNIDWQNHDGVNFGMINDFVRNQFYDRILSRHVKDQKCTDIGFGTGLLSMLALKYGADHVRAFESDYNRYLLGCEIISRLKLNSKIELINERYTHDYSATAVTFTETVNGNLWWEGLWASLPCDSNTVFLPGEYFLEVWIIEVSESFAQGLCRKGASNRRFNPGIDLDREFVDLVNNLANTNDAVSSACLTKGIVNFSREQETDWGWIPYMRAVQPGEIAARYSASQYVKDFSEFTMTVSTSAWKDKTVLIVPRAGMQQDNDKLYLDTGHWGPTESPILLHQPADQLLIKHDVRHGTISYHMD